MARLEIAIDANLVVPGQKVTGTVILHVDKPIKARLVVFEAMGGSSIRNRESMFPLNVPYANHTIILWMPKGGAKSGLLDTGNYAFPFSFTFPKCPPSRPWCITDRYDISVGYVCRARVDRVGAKDNVQEIPLIVSSALDLNTLPHSNSATKGHFDSNSGRADGFSVEVTVSKLGYLRGEPLDITLNIHNRSDKHSVTSLQLLVIELWHYERPTLFMSTIPVFETVVNHEEPIDVPPGESAILQRQIKLPLALHASFTYPMAGHNFKIEVTLKQDGFCSSPAFGEVPFFIGSVPVKKSGGEAASVSSHLKRTSKSLTPTSQED